MDGSRLFLIMRDPIYRYCLYRINPSGINEDETTVCQLDKPLYMFDESLFPNCMSFTAVGSKIYMVGGFSRKGDIAVYPSNKTFIYDTLSDTLLDGPMLNAGKSVPHLFTVGSKIYALSASLNRDGFTRGNKDPLPQFEVLDTDEIGGGWSPLPNPKLSVSLDQESYCIDACTIIGHAYSGAIVIYIPRAGSYVFDLQDKLWSHVSSENILPFRGHPTVIPSSPDCPSFCCTSALKTAFRLRYYPKHHGENNQVLQADSYAIENSPSKSSALPPRTFHDRSTTTFDRNGRCYYVTAGIDDMDHGTRFTGDRYVKVSVFDVRSEYAGLALKSGEERLEKGNGVKFELNKGQILKRCTNKKRKIGNEEDENKAGDEDKDEDEDETVKCELNQTQTLKRCSKKKRETRNVEEADETINLKMTTLWRRCFFGGPICDLHEHVTAAFAM